MANTTGYTESDILSEIKKRQLKKQEEKMVRQGVPKEAFDNLHRQDSEEVSSGEEIRQTQEQLDEIKRRQERQRQKQENMYSQMADELENQRRHSSEARGPTKEEVEILQQTNTERLSGIMASRKKKEYLDIDPYVDEDTGLLDGVLINDIRFGKSFSIDGDGLKFSPENESRLRISTDILEGVKVYMAKEFSDPRFVEMPRQQFITYAVLKLLPHPVRLAITKALEASDPNTLKIINDVMKAEPEGTKEKDVTIEDVLVDQLEETKQINKNLEYLKKNQEEDFPAVLYALSWLLLDRMNLRENLQMQTFEQALQEDGVYEGKDALIKEGKHMKKRDKTINNDSFR